MVTENESTVVDGCPLPPPHDDHDCAAYAAAALEGFLAGEARRSKTGVRENFVHVAFELTSDRADADAGQLAKAVEASLRKDFPDLMIRRLDQWESDLWI